jgi:hypothetical protein
VTRRISAWALWYLRAAEQLEAEVIAAICDLEAITVEHWERTEAGLDSARPAGGWGQGD